MAATPCPSPIVVRDVSHSFVTGRIRTQILYEVNAEIAAGEIVIMTGPSGSGKTTLLTLIGALRSAQEGSLKVLGRELRGAPASDLVKVRRKMGFIFQSQNLLNSLTAIENVQMMLRFYPGISRKAARERAGEILRAVGLGQRMHHYPDQLSGGQQQRVGVARALVTEPAIILADEPTASLDKKSGRDVVELMYHLARKQGTTVLLVTHDNRILDVADRVLHMEDGHLASYTTEVLSSTRSMLDAMARTNRSGELVQKVRDMTLEQFSVLLGEVTSEFEHYLRAIRVSNSDAFESMLEQVLESFTAKVGELLRAERATLYVVDEQKKELWSKVVRDNIEIRLPIGSGIAGHVARSGEPLNIEDAYSDPRFDRKFDEQTGYRTRSLLCIPLFSSAKRVFAVMQLLNKEGGEAFTAEDEEKFQELASEVGVILETWTSMRGYHDELS